MPEPQLNQSEQMNQTATKPIIPKAIPIINQKTIPTTTSPIDKLAGIQKLPTFAARGAAIGKALEQIKANPKYQALTPEHQAAVRANLYKRTVPASYSGFHLPIPNEQAWVSATGKSTSSPFDDKKLSESYGEHGLSKLDDQAMQPVFASLDKMELFGAHLSNKIVSTLNGLSQHFSHTDDSIIDTARKHPAARYDSVRVMQNWEDSARARVQSDTFWLDTHPRDTVLGKIANFAGENILTLPIYEAMESEVLAKAGLTIAAPSLTAKLAASPIGKFVAKLLFKATDGYLATYVTSGADNKEAIAGAVGFATIGGAVEVAPKLVTKIASAPLIKKWTANTVAMGGIPFAEDLAQSTYKELTPLDLLRKDTPNNVTFGKSHDLIMGIRVHPDSEGTGHFSTANGEIYKYSGKQNQQEVFNELLKKAQNERAEADPVVAKLHDAEAKTFNSISMAKFQRPMSSLTESERITTMAIRAKQIHEAASEAVVHLPDLQKSENEEGIQAARAQNPELDAAMKDWEKKFGSNFADAQTENDVKQIGEQTGIKSSRGAAKKVKKVTEASASLSPKDFLDNKTNTLAYLRAPQNRKKLVESLGSVGKENWNNFYETLKGIDKSKLQYEKPEQRLLMLYGDRGHLPVQLMHQIERRLKQTEEFSDKTPSQMFEQAKRLHAKVYDMARRGMLDIGSNIYASTKLTGSVAKGDKWTAQLSDETFRERTRATEMALKQHPAALKGFKATANRLQTLSKQAKTADEAAEFTKILENYSAGMLDFGSR